MERLSMNFPNLLIANKSSLHHNLSFYQSLLLHKNFLEVKLKSSAYIFHLLCFLKQFPLDLETILKYVLGLNAFVMVKIGIHYATVSLCVI